MASTLRLERDLTLPHKPLDTSQMLNKKALLLAKLKTYNPKSQAVILGRALAKRKAMDAAEKPKDPAST